jgi:hypothetical protein
MLVVGCFFLQRERIIGKPQPGGRWIRQIRGNTLVFTIWFSDNYFFLTTIQTKSTKHVATLCVCVSSTYRQPTCTEEEEGRQDGGQQGVGEGKWKCHRSKGRTGECEGGLCVCVGRGVRRGARGRPRDRHTFSSSLIPPPPYTHTFPSRHPGGCEDLRPS